MEKKQPRLIKPDGTVLVEGNMVICIGLRHYIVDIECPKVSIKSVSGGASWNVDPENIGAAWHEEDFIEYYFDTVQTID